MNHDEIRAALAAATPGPWQVYESMQADTFIYGPRGILRDDIIAGPTYNRENAHMIANAPTWLAELLAEVDRLTRWKAEALPVMTGLQELGKALGLTLGESITGPSAVDAAHALRARAEAAEQAVERVRELAEYWSVSGNSWRKAAARQFLHALDGGE